MTGSLLSSRGGRAEAALDDWRRAEGADPRAFRDGTIGFPNGLEALVGRFERFELAQGRRARARALLIHVG